MASSRPGRLPCTSLISPQTLTARLQTVTRSGCQVRLHSTGTGPILGPVGRLFYNMVVLTAPEPIARGEDHESAPCQAVLPRQFSVWPFGMRNVRLLLLIDPSRV